MSKQNITIGELIEWTNKVMRAIIFEAEARYDWQRTLRLSEDVRVLQTIRIRLLAAQEMAEAWKKIEKDEHPVNFPEHNHEECDHDSCGIVKMRKALSAWEGK